MDKKNLKEITYSSEFVAELENKITNSKNMIKRLRFENECLKSRVNNLERSNHYDLATYERALDLIIKDVTPFVGDLDKIIEDKYVKPDCLQDFWNECESIAEFYYVIATNYKNKEELGD